MKYVYFMKTNNRILSLLVGNLPGTLNAQNNDDNNSKVCYIDIAFTIQCTTHVLMQQLYSLAWSQ